MSASKAKQECRRSRCATPAKTEYSCTRGSFCTVCTIWVSSLPHLLRQLFLSLKCSTWSAWMVAGSVGTGDYRAVTFYLLRLFYLIFPFSFLKKILAKCGIRFNIFVCNPFWGKRSVL